ncbi:uncharacterized protein [Montipora capricornis]|uniref:uncharacterized protein n=1 Tax=Montipora capricornis TaxID=246305 RepID=UPI0035F1A63A
MRFHWRRDEHSPLTTLRFTRALFGLTSSPFLLGGVIEAHLSNWEEKEPEVVKKIRKELYVDDLISGSITVHKAREVKDKATVVFRDACFTLHKWHSNAPELEADHSSAEDKEETTYAKQQLGAPRGNMSRILGLSWNKKRDTVSVEVPTDQAKLTKRGILAKVQTFMIPWDLTLRGKLIYRAVIQREPGMQNYHVTWRRLG